MPVIPESMKKINAFEDVKVLTNKDIYEKVGQRMPQQSASGGKALFGLSKVQSAALGEQLVMRDLADELEKASKTAEKATETVETKANSTEVEKVPEKAE